MEVVVEELKLKDQLVEKMKEKLRDTRSKLLSNLTDVKMNALWIKLMLVSIETTNDLGQKDGFDPVFHGPYSFDEDPSNLEEEIKRTTSLFSQTLTFVNLFQDKLDEESEKVLKRTLGEFANDPEYENIKLYEVVEWLNRLEEIDESRKRNWQGHLKNLLDMIENFPGNN
jgi:hypothetical protein